MAVLASTLITEIRYELKDTTATDYNFPDAELLTYLNDAVEFLYQRVAAVHPEYWLYTGEAQVSGASAIPANCYHVIAVKANGEWKNELAFEQTLDTNADGYFILDNKVVVYGGGSPTVYYVARPTRVALAANVPLGDDFRQQYKEYVVLKAKARQTENLADFSVVFEKLTQQIDAHLATTNRQRWRGWSESEGGATAGDYVTEIRYELGDTNPANKQFSDGELLTYLSDAVFDMVTQIVVTWPFYWLSTDQTISSTQNIFSGTAVYPLPANCFKIIAVSLTSSTAITSLIAELDFGRTFEDAANGYYMRGRKVHLYPTPTAGVISGLTVYYIPRPNRIISAATAVPLDGDFRPLLKEYAVIKAKARLDKSTANVGALYEKLQRQLNAMITRTNLGKWSGWKTPARKFS